MYHVSQRDILPVFQTVSLYPLSAMLLCSSILGGEHLLFMKNVTTSIFSAVR